MTKISIAVAAALFVLPSTANAKIPVLDLGKVCSFMPIQVQHGQVHGFSNFSCQTGNFIGVVGRMSDGTRSVIASIQVHNRPKDQFLLQLSYPLVSGGTWTLSYTRSGYTVKVYRSGTYKVIK